MINANELRVGNWIIGCHKNEYIKVDGLFIMQIEDKNKTNQNNECPKPIPLTPEILCSLAFESIAGSTLYRLYIGNGEILFQDGHITFRLNDQKFELEIKCEYLHQLQNLFFALTGEELQVNLVV